jgi:putative chitinase
MPVDQALDYARTVEGGVMSFAWFWEENDINRLADTPGVADESKRINGGEHGLADRKRRFDAAVEYMLRVQA